METKVFVSNDINQGLNVESNLWIFIYSVTLMSNCVLLLHTKIPRHLRNSSNAIMTSTFVIDILFGSMYILPRQIILGYIPKLSYFCFLLVPLTTALLLNYNLYQSLICLYGYYSTHWSLQGRKKAIKYRPWLIGICWMVSLTTAYKPVISFRKLLPATYLRTSSNSFVKILYHEEIFIILYFNPRHYHNRQLHQNIVSISHQKSKSIDIRNNTQSGINIFISSKTLKVSVLMAILAFVFIVMMTPFITILTSQILHLPIALSIQGNYYYLHKAFHYLAFSYSEVNPMVYVYFVGYIDITCYKHCVICILYKQQLIDINLSGKD